MLNRNDLTKQFELVVKQEIKNHNDQMYETNQALNQMRADIRVISENEKEHFAVYKAKSESAQAQLRELKALSIALSQRIDSFANDQRIINERNAYNDNEIASAIERIIQRQVICEDKVRVNEARFSNLESLFAQVQEDIDGRIDSFNQKMICDLASFEKRLIERPSDASLVKSQLEEKISAYKVDVEGIMKEINAFKKMLFIDEKKIENIYTIIDRIKGGIS